MESLAQRRRSRSASACAACALRVALSFEIHKNDRSTRRLSTGRIPSFDIRHSIFSIRYSLFYPRMRRRKAEVSFPIKLAASAAGGGADT